MSDEVYGFGYETAKALNELVSGGVDTPSASGAARRIGCRIGKTGTGGIPARTGTTAGQGDVTIYVLNSGTGALTSTGIVRKAFNVFGSAVGDEVYVVMDEDPISGALIVVAEDCS